MSVKKTKTDMVFNNNIILGSCTTSVLSQKRHGEEKTHFDFGNPTDVERVGHHGGAPVGHQVRLLDHPHIPETLEQRVPLYKPRQIRALLRRGLQVQVHHVAVAGVVQHQQHPLHRIAISGGARHQVGQARRRRERGDR